MSGVDINFTSVAEVERVLIGAAEQLAANPSEDNIRYFNLIYEAWKRKDWVVERALYLLNQLGPSKILLDESDSSTANNATYTPVNAVQSEFEDIRLTGFTYIFTGTSEFNNDTGDHILCYITSLASPQDTGTPLYATMLAQTSMRGAAGGYQLYGYVPMDCLLDNGHVLLVQIVNISGQTLATRFTLYGKTL